MNIIDRRQFMKLSAAAAATAAAPGMSFAQAKPLVVGSYAGVFEEAMREAFVKPYEAKGGSVQLSVGGSGQWLSQVEANPENPPIDVILCAPRDAMLAGRKGLYDKIDGSKMPNLADVPEVFVDVNEGWAVGFDYGANGLVYNADRIKNPPKSIAEFVERTAAGEWVASLPNLGWMATPAALIWSYNDALGGTVDDITPFIEAMKKMRPNLITWSGGPDFLTQMQAGDADIGLYLDGRAWAFNKAGNPWFQFINPEEGASVEALCAMKPKNANPAAWDFINTMLGAQEQSIFADMTYYGMTNSKIQYSDAVKDLVTDWTKGRMVPNEVIAEATPAWVERWNKELGI